MSSPKIWKAVAMARTDDDSWDITEGVGATALGVAWSRSEEASGETGKVNEWPSCAYAKVRFTASERTFSDCCDEDSFGRYSDSWNSTIAVTVSTASRSATTRSATVGADSTA